MGSWTVYDPIMRENINRMNSSYSANNVALGGNLWSLIVRNTRESQNEWTSQSNNGLSLCLSIPDLVMACGLRLCSQPCTSSICQRADLLATNFCKSYGPGRLSITENSGFLDVRLTHLCPRKIVASSSHSDESASISDMDLTEALGTYIGTQRTNMLFAM